MKNAIGEYIFFADADDFFLPNLNQVLDDFKTNDNFDIIFFNSISLDSETLIPSHRGRDWSKLRNKLGDEKKLEDHLKYLFGEPWCKLIKRSLIVENNIHFDEIPIHNDTFFSYMIGFNARNIKIDDRAIYCITTRNNSVSKTINNKNLLIRAEVFAKKNKFFKEHDLPYFDKLLLAAFYPIKNNDDLKRKFYQILQSNGISQKEFILKLIHFYPLLIKNKLKYMGRKMINKF